MRRYFIYGVTFSSPLSFLSPLPSSAQPPSLLVTARDAPRPTDGLQVVARLAEAYQNPLAPHTIYRHDDEDVLQFEDGTQILVDPSQIVHASKRQSEVRPDLMDVRLLGPAFAWWVLRVGQIPFHAGAMLVDGEALLFSADSRTGKSSLLCSLLERGVPLLADDFVAVRQSPQGELVAASAYPQMRLWPGTLQQFVGGSPGEHPPVSRDSLKRRVRVGDTWGHFLEGLFPLSRIYLLERRDGQEAPVTVRQLSGHEAFMALLASITMGSLFPLSDVPPVLSLVQEVAWRVPVYRLSYPSGWHWLPTVHEAIFDPKRFLAAPLPPGAEAPG